jgi:hypothetical protein
MLYQLSYGGFILNMLRQRTLLGNIPFIYIV